MSIVFFVTGNKNKYNETKYILGNNIKLIQHDIDLPELQGEPYEIIKEKCRIAHQKVKGAILIEDTSLCFNALGGMPGPYIKWFLKNTGAHNIVKMLDSFEDKSAYAMCIFAYQDNTLEKPILFEGRVDGIIVPQKGESGFGWDPIFEVGGETFAKMDKSIKNKISHRAKALEKVKKYFKKE
jgi:inosine triphosphate pyrophosphatase